MGSEGSIALTSLPSLSSDCRTTLIREFPFLPIPLDASGIIDSDAMLDQEHQYALFPLNGLLERQATPNRPHSLALHNLPIHSINFDEFAKERNRYVREEMRYDHTLDSATRELHSLNLCQRSCADRIFNATECNGNDEYSHRALFFLDVPGGIGKTKVQNTYLPIFVRAAV